MSEKNIKLVIAEKTSVAQSIAKVIGADKREDGYLEGKRLCLKMENLSENMLFSHLSQIKNSHLTPGITPNHPRGKPDYPFSSDNLKFPRGF